VTNPIGDKSELSQSSDKLPVQILSKDDLIRGLVSDLPGADRDGYHRSAYPGIVGTDFRSTMVVVPLGQRSTARQATFEHIIVVLEGAFLFTVDGVGYRVEQLGQILIPIGVTWEYENAELRQSSFLSITAPH
jgi:quercetin dioxygenase-like cupin family protein